MKTKLMNLSLMILLSGCMGTSNFTKTETDIWKPRYQLQAGINHGGITENRDFVTTPEVNVDAFSGATNIGGNIGAHVQLPIYKNAIETGIDYLYNSQTFTYHDPKLGFEGTRKLGTSQFIVPITYNIGLFRKTYYSSLMYLKFGYAAQINLLNVNNNGELPPYTYKHFSGGMTFGLSSFPCQLKNKASIGFYIDAYRGSKAYDDFYNSDVYEMPGTSYFKLGVIYQFK